MISDDVSTLFGDGPPGVRFRQGRITFWNPANGENQIDMGGGTLNDVPILNTGEAIALKEGHIVGLLGQGLSWFIVGRITPPNDPNFASASVAFGRAQDFQQGFAQPAAKTLKASATITVPAWADEAAVMCVATGTLVNNQPNRVEGLIYAGINTVTGSAMAQGIGTASEPYSMAAMTAVNSAILSSPGSSITVQCYLDCTFALAANGINTATVDAIAIFRSIT